MTPAAERNASQDLLFWRAVCDLGLGIRFLSYHYWNQYICNADQCYIVERKCHIFVVKLYCSLLTLCMINL